LARAWLSENCRIGRRCAGAPADIGISCQKPWHYWLETPEICDLQHMDPESGKIDAGAKAITARRIDLPAPPEGKAGRKALIFAGKWRARKDSNL
jgi:hypothetical protein